MLTITKNGKTITFYSYKGGVGRSMALINVACLLAKKGKKVLMIDWDLEAPGLESYFNGEVKKTDLGLVDLILDSQEFLKVDVNNNETNLIEYLDSNLQRFIKTNLKLKIQKNLKGKNKENNAFTLDLIKAGKFDDNYTERLSSINWMEFYAKTPEYFRTLAQHLEKEYDYILIDSRTGLADTSGVCTMLMPSVLVLVFALNQQNIDGVIKVAKQSLEYRFGSHDERNLNIFPLPSRIETANSEKYQEWEDNFKNGFENLFKNVFHLERCELRNYFDIAKIKYDSSNSYGENVPVLVQNLNNSNLISYDYDQFTRILDREIPIWEYLSDEEIKLKESKIETLEKQKNYKETIELLELISPYKIDDSSYLVKYSHNLIEYSKKLDDNHLKNILFERAYELSSKQNDLTGDSYNLACVSSLLNKKAEAISLINLILEDEENLEYYKELIFKDLEYDFVNIKDEPKFKKLLKKYHIQ